MAVASAAPIQIEQVPLAPGLAQQHDRLVVGKLHPDSDDLELAHSPTVPAGRRLSRDRPATARRAPGRRAAAATAPRSRRPCRRRGPASAVPRWPSSGLTTCSTSPTSRSAAVRNARRCRGSMPNAASSAADRGDLGRDLVVLARAAGLHQAERHQRLQLVGVQPGARAELVARSAAVEPTVRRNCGARHAVGVGDRRGRAGRPHRGTGSSAPRCTASRCSGSAAAASSGRAAAVMA